MLCVQRSKYEQLGNDRTLVAVRVLSPERVMGGMWELYWTIKRERDPNGRKFLFPSAYSL